MGFIDDIKYYLTDYGKEFESNFPRRGLTPQQELLRFVRERPRPHWKMVEFLKERGWSSTGASEFISKATELDFLDVAVEQGG